MANYGVNQNTPYGQRLASDARSQRADFWKKTVLPIAAFATGGAALAAGGGAAGAASLPAAATEGVGFSAAPVASTAGRFSLSHLLDLGKLGSSLFGTISGNRAQSQAQAQALAEQARQFDLQQRMLAENEAVRRSENQRLTDEQARQWNATQQFQAKQFQAQEEQRLHDRALADAAEARKAPRRAVSQQALMRLSDFLGLARS